MKCDMAGAAAVFAAVVTAARLGLKVNVTGWLALAENMPSGSAVRPGDVLRMYSGKTVEVLNTDAEGRLVLGDALTRASEERPDAIVDVATLTGAMVLALGNRTFAIMGNDESFRTAIHEIAEEAGEQSWPMPMPAELRKGMESATADIANMGERMGGGLVAGLFLQEFVGEDIAWAHLDIAGPAFNEGGPVRLHPPRAAPAPRSAPWWRSPSAPPRATSADPPRSRRGYGPGQASGAVPAHGRVRPVSPSTKSVPPYAPVTPGERSLTVSHSGPASRRPSTSAKMGSRQDRAPTTGPNKKRPNTSRRPVIEDRARRTCMEDVTWRTTPAPFST